MAEVQSLIGAHAVVRLPEGATVLEAVRAMAEHNVGAILVCETDLRPRGIFSERDLMRRVVLAGRDCARVRLSEVMTRELYTVDRRAPIDQVRRQLQERHIRHVPVLDGKVCVAVLSLRDLLRADLERCALELHETKLYIQGEPGTAEPAP